MAKSGRAAIVDPVGQPPKIKEVQVEEPADGFTQVKVIAAGLHQLVRSRASGKHYSVHTTGPVIPGVDGVGELPNGEKVFFTSFDPKSTPSFSEYANIANHDIFKLPAGATAKPEIVAALANPSMSSYMAYQHRVQVKPGFSVLIMGVTGASGQIAAQISKHFGASKVIGAGRNQNTLNQLKASGFIDESITLVDDAEALKKVFATTANGVDLVLDYIWGPAVEAAIAGIFSARANPSQRLDWVQIGNMAGANIQFSAPILRQANFHICGSGLGSVSQVEMRKSMSELAVLLAQGKFTYPVDIQPFSKIEQLWAQQERPESRLVLVWSDK